MICRVIICIEHDMRDSWSRMFATYRLPFEEDLLMVASIQGSWPLFLEGRLEVGGKKGAAACSHFHQLG